MAIFLHHNDLPKDVVFKGSVAIDTETMGLNPLRDRLCLVQLSAGDGDCHIVQFAKGQYDAPHLKALLADQSVTKIFHFARFDIGVLWVYLNVLTTPVYCTKIASKLVRTFTQYHGLKNLCGDLLGVEISKKEQTSDWGAAQLTPDQLEYAASDVLHLHKMKAKLDEMLIREGRVALAEACYQFLPHRSILDVAGFGDEDIFSH
jgi:ribonuclease D